MDTIRTFTPSSKIVQNFLLRTYGSNQIDIFYIFRFLARSDIIFWMKQNSKTQSIGILGAGRQAATTAGYLKEMGCTVEFFFCDSAYVHQENPLLELAPIISEKSDLSGYKNILVISAVGSSKLRKHLVDLWPFDNFFTLVHPRAWVSETAVLGHDVTIPPMAVINVSAQIGNHVLLHVGDTIGHDTTLEDFVSLSPGVHIAGRVTIGQGSFLGIGACVRDTITIGNGVLVASGAMVVSDVANSVQVIGVPAKMNKKLTEWY